MTPKAEQQPGAVSREPMRVGGRFDSLIPIVMVLFLLGGTLLILTNYIFLASPSNTYLLIGLGLVLVGIVAATQWR